MKQPLSKTEHIDKSTSAKDVNGTYRDDSVKVKTQKDSLLERVILPRIKQLQRRSRSSMEVRFFSSKSTTFVNVDLYMTMTWLLLWWGFRHKCDTTSVHLLISDLSRNGNRLYPL